MDLRKIGVFLIFIGILITIAFLDNEKIFVPALTITVLGFLLQSLVMYLKLEKEK